MTDEQMTRRAGLGKGLRLAFVAPAVVAAAVPGEAAASSGPSKPSKAKRAPVVPAPRPGFVAPPPAAQLQPVGWTAANNAVVPQGTERMVSDPVRLGGPRGDGSGPVRVDLEGAQPNATYEVAFVPSYDARAVLPLGVIRTDGRGVFHGAAPEQVPPLLEHQRTGTLVIRRVPTV